MAKGFDIALGLVFTGAVSASLGRAVSDTKSKVTGLRNEAQKTTAFKGLIDETRKLETELKSVERQSRKLGLDQYRKLKTDSQQLASSWEAATRKVGGLSRELAALQHSKPSAGVLSGMLAELPALQNAALHAKNQLAAKQAQLHSLKNEADADRGALSRLRGEISVLRDQSRIATNAVRDKTAQIKMAEKTAREAAVQEKALASSISRARHEASRAKESWQQNRNTLAQMKVGLRDASNEASKLEQHYQRLARSTRGMELKTRGRERISAGAEKSREAVGDAVKLSAVVAVPTMISANYQAIIRDLAIKSGIAGTAQEADISRQVAQGAQQNGIGRNELAEAVNQLVSGGMDLSRAVDFAPLIAKFSVGQGSGSVDTAKMVMALEQNAKISDPKAMLQAMEAIAYLGKAGSFESNDMARWFPELLAEMQKLGIAGQDSVTQLGAMLQVQMKVAGSSDQAANNLKNWFSKIGSAETKKSYKDAGIDYEAKMREAIGKGWSTLESSFVLARAYIEKIDPERAKQLAAAAAQINKEQDPTKQKAMLQAFDETMKTGDLFTDMQVKAALTAYMQNAKLYQDLKRDSAKANGDLERDLADRRATSKQAWSEMGQAWDEAARKVGDAIRPVTDRVAHALTTLASGIGNIAEAAPVATAALVALAGGFVAYKSAKAAWNIGRGAIDLARGSVLTRSKGKLPGKLGQMLDAVTGGPGMGVQQVYVTNWPAGGMGGSDGFDLPDRKGRTGRVSRVGRALGRMRAGLNGAGGRLVGGALELVNKAGRPGMAIANLGRTALMAPTLGSLGSLGAGSLATAGGMVAAAGAAGYGIGTLINKGIGKITGGGDGWLGGWLYDKLHGDEMAKITAPVSFAEINALHVKQGKPPLPPSGAIQPAVPSRTPVAPIVVPSLTSQQAAAKTPTHSTTNKPMQVSFAPTVQVTVHGDVKDPRQLAQDLMPHLKQLFGEFQQQLQRSALHDAAHV